MPWRELQQKLILPQPGEKRAGSVKWTAVFLARRLVWREICSLVAVCLARVFSARLLIPLCFTSYIG